jgi:hypothetical protein
MPVTPEEKQKYMAFVTEQVKTLKCLEVNPDEIVWHYTSGDALLSIIDSGTLYATQVSGLTAQKYDTARSSIEKLLLTFKRKILARGKRPCFLSD